MALSLPLHRLHSPPPNPILGIFFNQDDSIFCVARTDGWEVYRTYDSTFGVRRVGGNELANASLRFVVPLFESNVLFLVGGPPSPLYPPNKVIIWDDKLGAPLAELEFGEEVKGLAARKDRLIVLFKRRVVVFALGQGDLGIWREGVYETVDNPKGLVALASKPNSTLLCFPGRQHGHVQLVHLPVYNPDEPPWAPPPSHDPSKAPFPSFAILRAHTTQLAAISTTQAGNLVATSSVKGTLIRIWDPASAQCIRELRRGTDGAEIYGIRFRPDGGAVCVSSDKGTIHVWQLDESKELKQSNDEKDDPLAKPLNMIKPYLPKYFSSEWSHSQFRLPPPPPTIPSGRSFSFAPSTFSSEGFGESSKPSSSSPEESVCLCAWIEAAGDAYYGNEETGRHETEQMKHRPSDLPPFRSRTKSDPPAPSTQPALARRHSQIIAVTYSGGWYRISTAGSTTGSTSPAPPGRSSPIPASPSGYSSSRDSSSSSPSCRLVEYRRFLDKDGWN